MSLEAIEDTEDTTEAAGHRLGTTRGTTEQGKSCRNERREDVVPAQHGIR